MARSGGNDRAAMASGETRHRHADCEEGPSVAPGLPEAGGNLWRALFPLPEASLPGGTCPFAESTSGGAEGQGRSPSACRGKAPDGADAGQRSGGATAREERAVASTQSPRRGNVARERCPGGSWDRRGAVVERTVASKVRPERQAGSFAAASRRRPVQTLTPLSSSPTGRHHHVRTRATRIPALRRRAKRVVAHASLAGSPLLACAGPFDGLTEGPVIQPVPPNFSHKLARRELYKGNRRHGSGDTTGRS